MTDNMTLMSTLHETLAKVEGGAELANRLTRHLEAIDRRLGDVEVVLQDFHDFMRTCPASDPDTLRALNDSMLLVLGALKELQVVKKDTSTIKLAIVTTGEVLKELFGKAAPILAALGAVLATVATLLATGQLEPPAGQPAATPAPIHNTTEPGAAP